MGCQSSSRSRGTGQLLREFRRRRQKIARRGAGTAEGATPVVARSAEPAAEVASAAFRRSGGRDAVAGPSAPASRNLRPNRSRRRPRRGCSSRSREAFRVCRPSRAFARRGGDGDDLRPSGCARPRLGRRGPTGRESAAFAGPSEQTCPAQYTSQFRSAGAQRRRREERPARPSPPTCGRANRRNQDEDRRRRRRNDPLARQSRRILPVRAAAGIRGAGGAVGQVHRACGPRRCSASRATHASPVAEPDRSDKRFADPAWRDNPFFDFIKQAYVLTTRWADDLVRRGRRTRSARRARRRSSICGS